MTHAISVPRFRIGDLILTRAIEHLDSKFTSIGVVVEYDLRREHFNAMFIYRNSLAVMSVLKRDRVIAR